MKEVLNEFTKLFANCILLLALILASFLLLINLYHSREISYVLNVNLSDNTKFNNFKDLLDKSEEDVTNLDITGNRYTTANQIKSEILKCITLIKSSKAYNLADNRLNTKDIYDLNTELYEKINTDCLFAMGYNIERYMTNSKSTSFKPTYEQILDNKRIITFSSEYIKNRIIANSSYSFVTEVTRNSLFNEQDANFSSTMDNYITLSKTVELVSNWYKKEFGGNK